MVCEFYNRLNRGILTVSVAGLLALFTVMPGGCKDEHECNRNSDCGDLELCENHKCMPIVNDSGTTQINVSSDTPYQGDSSESTDADSASGSDTVIDSDSGTTTVPIDSETVTADTVADTTTFGECLRNDDCDDGNPCTADYCKFNAVPYSCDTELLADGSLCDDSDPCNGQDICQSGTCAHGANPCVDLVLSNGCGLQVASCDPTGSAARLCVYEKSLYDDGTACMVGNPCMQGACTMGECADPGNACGEQTDPCSGQVCAIVGATVDDFECTPWFNETDTNCVSP